MMLANPAERAANPEMRETLAFWSLRADVEGAVAREQAARPQQANNLSQDVRFIWQEVDGVTEEDRIRFWADLRQVMGVALHETHVTPQQGFAGDGDRLPRRLDGGHVRRPLQPLQLVQNELGDGAGASGQLHDAYPLAFGPRGVQALECPPHQRAIDICVEGVPCEGVEGIALVHQWLLPHDGTILPVTIQAMGVGRVVCRDYITRANGSAYLLPCVCRAGAPGGNAYYIRDNWNSRCSVRPMLRAGDRVQIRCAARLHRVR